MYLILFSILLAVNYSAGDQKFYTVSKEKIEKVKPTIYKCLNDTGAQAISLLQIKDIDQLGSLPSVKPLVLCVFRGINLIRPEGNFNTDETLSYFPDEADKPGVKKIIEECNKEKGKEPLDTTLQVYKCYLKKSPSRLSLPTTLTL